MGFTPWNVCRDQEVFGWVAVFVFSTLLLRVSVGNTLAMARLSGGILTQVPQKPRLRGGYPLPATTSSDGPFAVVHDVVACDAVQMVGIGQGGPQKDLNVVRARREAVSVSFLASAWSVTGLLTEVLTRYSETIAVRLVTCCLLGTSGARLSKKYDLPASVVPAMRKKIPSPWIRTRVIPIPITPLIPLHHIARYIYARRSGFTRDRNFCVHRSSTRFSAVHDSRRCSCCCE